MHGRKMRLSPIYRRWMERELTKSGDSLEELQALSDDQFYARCVCYVQCRHTGVLPTVSRVVIWRSSKIDAKSLADSSKLSQLRAIHDECGAMSGRVSAFVPEEPYTLETQLMANKQVLVADVELVIRHGKDTFYHKCPYYLRLWFNEQHGFWQPVFLFYARIIYPSAPDDIYSDYWF
jgi:hypothetical protein